MPSPYKRLSRPNSIRLLNIDPAADPASPLVCTLEEIDLHAQDATYRAFSALSYRWGPRSHPVASPSTASPSASGKTSTTFFSWPAV